MTGGHMADGCEPGWREREKTLTRSLRTSVRNPVLALPAMQRALKSGRLERMILREILLDISADARARAEKCWRTHKAPMAAYWKAVAVYAGHTARALR